jgi:hypothetical protein
MQETEKDRQLAGKREGGRGGGRRQMIGPRESLVLYNTVNTLWCDHYRSSSFIFRCNLSILRLAHSQMQSQFTEYYVQDNADFLWPFILLMFLTFLKTNSCFFFLDAGIHWPIYQVVTCFSLWIVIKSDRYNFARTNCVRACRKQIVQKYKGCTFQKHCFNTVLYVGVWSSGQIHSPWLRDIVDYGLSYRPSSLYM